MTDTEKLLSILGEVIDASKVSVFKLEDIYDKNYLTKEHVPYTGSILGVQNNELLDSEEYFKDVDLIVDFYKTKGTQEGLQYLMKKFNIQIELTPLWTADV